MDACLGSECGRVGTIPKPNGRDARAQALEIFLMVAQPGDVLAAENSAIVAQKGHDGRPLRPQVSEPLLSSIGVGQYDRRESFSDRRSHRLTPQGVLLARDIQRQ